MYAVQPDGPGGQVHVARRNLEIFSRSGRPQKPKLLSRDTDKFPLPPPLLLFRSIASVPRIVHNNLLVSTPLARVPRPAQSPSNTDRSGIRKRKATKSMALLAPSPRVLYRDLCCVVAREAAAAVPSSAAAACSTVSGAAGTRPLQWLSPGVGRADRRRGGVRAEAAYFWDVSQPVEMTEIDTMEKLDEALRLSVEHKQPVIIDWMASWCRKCIYLKPKLEKIAGEFPGVRFYYVDVNKVPQPVVKRGNISKMPTIQLWKDGEWKEEVIGGHKAWLVMDEVREMIQKYK